MKIKIREEQYQKVILTELGESGKNLLSYVRRKYTLMGNNFTRRDGSGEKWYSPTDIKNELVYRFSISPKMAEEMLDYYLTTTITESIPPKPLIKESGFARIQSMLEGIVGNVNSYVILTAHNPCNCNLSSADNNKQNKKLEKAIRKMGYGFTDTQGDFFYQKEDSLFIPNMTKEDGIELGIKFKQYAIIYGFKDINKFGNPFFVHNMVRTYCNQPCPSDNMSNQEKYRWDNMSLDAKLRKLTSLPAGKVGEIISKAYVTLAGPGVQKRQTNFSSKKGRKFLFPFFDDPYNYVRPGKKLGTNTSLPIGGSIDDYHDAAERLSLDDKFAAMGYDEEED